MNGDALAAPFFIAAALLALAGASKVHRPRPLTRALRTLGLPATGAAVRAFGALEVGIGGLALADPAPAIALALAAMYGGFSLFLLYAIIARVPLDSCGCLGEREAPPSGVHVVLDLIAVGVSIVVARSSLEGAPLFIAHLSYRAVPFTLGAAAAAYLAYLSAAFAHEVLGAPSQVRPQHANGERSESNAG